MSTASKTSFIDFDEFCLLIDDGRKADLIDGVIYMASPDNTDANELNVWLSTLMSVFARRKRLGKVFVSRVAFRLDDKNAARSGERLLSVRSPAIELRPWKQAHASGALHRSSRRCGDSPRSPLKRE
jgi:hypothetical protein